MDSSWNLYSGFCFLLNFLAMSSTSCMSVQSDAVARLKRSLFSSDLILMWSVNGILEKNRVVIFFYKILICIDPYNI